MPTSSIYNCTIYLCAFFLFSASYGTGCMGSMGYMGTWAIPFLRSQSTKTPQQNVCLLRQYWGITQHNEPYLFSGHSAVHYVYVTSRQIMFKKRLWTSWQPKSFSVAQIPANVNGTQPIQALPSRVDSLLSHSLCIHKPPLLPVVVQRYQLPILLRYTRWVVWILASSSSRQTCTQAIKHSPTLSCQSGARHLAQMSTLFCAGENVLKPSLCAWCQLLS